MPYTAQPLKFANLKAQRLPCCICWQPIDYTLPTNDRGAFTTAHLLPRAYLTHS